MLLHGFRPDRNDLVGAIICLAGVGLIQVCTPRLKHHASTSDHQAMFEHTDTNKAIVQRLIDEILNGATSG